MTWAPSTFIAAGCTTSASHLSVVATMGQERVAELVSPMPPPEKAETLSGCCMPQVPGPSIALPRRLT
jgi:hypothetical protein